MGNLPREAAELTPEYLLAFFTEAMTAANLTDKDRAASMIIWACIVNPHKVAIHNPNPNPNPKPRTPNPNPNPNPKPKPKPKPNPNSNPNPNLTLTLTLTPNP